MRLGEGQLWGSSGLWIIKIFALNQIFLTRAGWCLIFYDYERNCEFDPGRIYKRPVHQFIHKIINPTCIKVWSALLSRNTYKTSFWFRSLSFSYEGNDTSSTISTWNLCNHFKKFACDHRKFQLEMTHMIHLLWWDCDDDLTLYELNFAEGSYAYIYISCHYSTLIWHRYLKSFLK